MDVLSYISTPPYLRHKLCMDFLGDPVNIGILYRDLQDNTQHFHHKSLQHKDLYTRDSIGHKVYLEGNLRCIDIWVCMIELKIILNIFYTFHYN